MLGPEEINYFTNRRTTARNQTGRGLAQNMFLRGQQQLRSSMSRDNLEAQYRPARDRIQQNAAVRGMSSSGFYRDGLRQLLENRLRGLRDIELGEQGTLGQLTLSDQDLEASLAEQLSGIDSEELMRRILAAQIREVQ